MIYNGPLPTYDAAWVVGSKIAYFKHSPKSSSGLPFQGDIFCIFASLKKQSWLQ